MLKLALNRYFPRIKLHYSSVSNTRISNLDVDYLCNTKTSQEIKENISKRKGIGNIQLVHELNSKLQQINEQNENYAKLKAEFLSELHKIPNRTHPAVSNYGTDPKIIKTTGNKMEFSREPLEFQEICKKLKLVRTEQLGVFSGSKSYYILGELAELEHALVRYFVDNLRQNQFQLISVPDILPRDMVEGCGMNTRGTRTQVYSLHPDLHPPDLCLSGTSEIALAGYLSNQELDSSDLPLKLAAVSRCYRAETSNVVEERGIYRVHEFTKVEMFVVSTPETSDTLLEDIREQQEKMFASLGLHFVVLDMPAHELGAQAYRKYDIEAWLSGRKLFGEISSCSNCLDYQSRRLGIRYRAGNGGDEPVFVHTLNGTACAIPRLLIALVEQGQNKNGTVSVPEVLQGYMQNKKVIGKQKRIPELRLVKNKK